MRQNGRVSSTFPRAPRSVRGYDVDQVEAFLATARDAYSDTGGTHPLDSGAIRNTAFAMVRGGYDPKAVDAALERLEDAFAQREREQLTAAVGDTEWNTEARAMAQSLVDRLSRPSGARFRRSGLLTTGYRVRDVDEFAERVTGFLLRGAPLTAAEVREVVFRPAKRGYDEAQVDLVLDTLVRTMLAVR